MGEEPLEGGEGPDPGAGSGTETEYPKAPGASKMEALRRIERSLEEQTEHTPDRERAGDARKEGSVVDGGNDGEDGSRGDRDE